MNKSRKLNVANLPNGGRGMWRLLPWRISAGHLLTWLPAADQSRCLQLNRAIGDDVQQAHRARHWIWNAVVDMKRIANKSRSVLEIRGLTNVPWEWFWRQKNARGRFTRLVHVSFASFPIPMHGLHETLQWPLTLVSMEIGAKEPLFEDNVIEPWQSFPPNLEFLYYTTVLNVLRVRRAALPPKLKVLKGIHGNILKEDKLVPWPPQLDTVAITLGDMNQLPKTVTDLTLEYCEGDQQLPASVCRLAVRYCAGVAHYWNSVMWPQALEEISVTKLQDGGIRGVRLNWPANLRILRIGIKTFGDPLTWGVRWKDVEVFEWPKSLQRLECHRLRMGKGWKRILADPTQLPAHWPKDVSMRVWATVRRVVVFERI